MNLPFSQIKISTALLLHPIYWTVVVRFYFQMTLNILKANIYTNKIQFESYIWQWQKASCDSVLQSVYFLVMVQFILIESICV